MWRIICLKVCGFESKKNYFCTSKLNAMLENFSFQDFKNKLQSDKQTKLVTFLIVGLLVLILGYFAYRQFIWSPANEKSKDAFWVGLNYAAKDSIDLAIEELQPVVKKYDGKIGGENAQFVLARQYMQKGEFQKALSLLEDVDVNDTYVSAMVIGLQGDCQSEMKNYEKAYNLYLEASGINENEMTTPMYLFKAGLCAEKNKDFEHAAECFIKIRDDFPGYGNQKAIEKYVARASNKKVK
jgi:tetratricopeptide (TPR) repeat protein